MRKTIFKKVKARAGFPYIWRVEAAQFPFKATITWSRSTPGSSLILDTGVLATPKIDLGSYNRTRKHYEVDLSDGSIVFLIPTEIILRTKGNASVLIGLDCEFPDLDNRVRPVPKGELNIIRHDQLVELPVTPVDLTAFSNELEAN